jgi:hypothetical protein
MHTQNLAIMPALFNNLEAASVKRDLRPVACYRGSSEMSTICRGLEMKRRKRLEGYAAMIPPTVDQIHPSRAAPQVSHTPIQATRPELSPPPLLSPNIPQFPAKAYPSFLPHVLHPSQSFSIQIPSRPNCNVYYCLYDRDCVLISVCPRWR